MKRYLILGTFLCIFLMPQNVYSEEKVYVLIVDEHSFDIAYDVNANVLAMAIDKELRSLLVGLKNTEDSIFTIKLQKEIISAQNNEFVVLVNGREVDYNISQDSTEFSLSFYVPKETEEVEIIGTNVIPEFPFGVFFGLILMSSVAITMNKLRPFK